MYVHVCIKHTGTYALDTAHMRTKIQAHTCTYMHICIDLNQSICVCMCLYVNGIQANMHLIQPLSENRYIQIHTDTCTVCITYRPCICDMDCLISCTYVRAYVSCMCFTYIHIYQSICVLYVLQIHAHMHWQDH